MRATSSRGEPGLRHIVVGTEFQTENAIDGVASGGEHQDGGTPLFANALQGLDAGDTGHHDVENDEVKLFVLEGLQTFGARMRGRGLKAFERKVVDEQRDELDVVVDDEDFRRTCVHK